jgi:glucosamine 6-phosphate synthetase-like amidotransferase/phosphosugar isomerase protein
MCGIFGILGVESKINNKIFADLGLLSERRGKDSSGVFYSNIEGFSAARADFKFSQLIKKEKIDGSFMAMGHSRLITNGQSDNQPVIRDGIAVIHNGIITNDAEYWSEFANQKLLSIDTEVILDVAIKLLVDERPISELYDAVSSACEGSFSVALCIPRLGKLVLMSNTGSLYIGLHDESICFASEYLFFSPPSLMLATVAPCSSILSHRFQSSCG